MGFPPATQIGPTVEEITFLMSQNEALCILGQVVLRIQVSCQSEVHPTTDGMPSSAEEMASRMVAPGKKKE